MCADICTKLLSKLLTCVTGSKCADPVGLNLWNEQSTSLQLEVHAVWLIPRQTGRTSLPDFSSGVTGRTSSLLVASAVIFSKSSSSERTSRAHSPTTVLSRRGSPQPLQHLHTASRETPTYLAGLFRLPASSKSSLLCQARSIMTP